MVFTDYLDLYDVFVNKIAGGDTVIFIALSFVVIAFMAAKFRFPNQVTLMMFFVYGLILSATFSSILAIVLFIAGSVFAYGLGKAIKDN